MKREIDDDEDDELHIVKNEDEIHRADSADEIWHDNETSRSSESMI